MDTQPGHSCSLRGEAPTTNSAIKTPPESVSVYTIAARGRLASQKVGHTQRPKFSIFATGSGQRADSALLTLPGACPLTFEAR